MQKYSFALIIVFYVQMSFCMQPQAPPTVQNRTIIVPARANARPVTTPMRGLLGPVVGGVPPYSYELRYQDLTNTVTLWNGTFIVTPSQLPYSFEYIVTDSQGRTSAPATITIEPGANLQIETQSLSEVEPG